jgi:RNA polymerase sigma-70 factor (ECF subfamily)
VNVFAAPAIVSSMNEVIGRKVGSEGRATMACATRDEAFAALTRRHIDAAYRLAWAILTDDVDADDATQDAFALAWRNRRSLRDQARFDAWFGRILVNVCRERLRQRARARTRPLAESDERSMADFSAQTSSRDAISRAMTRLDADHRIVVVLRYWADLTVDEIAERLDVPPGTVKSRLHYALRSMRPRLEDAR